jgi:hypothetical protein
MKGFPVLIGGLALMFVPFCINAQESPEMRDSCDTCGIYDLAASAPDDKGFYHSRVEAAGGRENKVLQGSDCEIDCTNAVLGSNCDIDCTSADHGTDD